VEIEPLHQCRNWRKFSCKHTINVKICFQLSQDEACDRKRSRLPGKRAVAWFRRDAWRSFMSLQTIESQGLLRATFDRGQWRTLLAIHRATRHFERQQRAGHCIETGVCAVPTSFTKPIGQRPAKLARLPTELIRAMDGKAVTDMFRAMARGNAAIVANCRQTLRFDISLTRFLSRSGTRRLSTERSAMRAIDILATCLTMTLRSGRSLGVQSSA
jgi:hypothetical protein